MAAKSVPWIQEAVGQLLCGHALHRKKESFSAGFRDVRAEREEDQSHGHEEEHESQGESDEALFGLCPRGAVPHTPPPPEKC
jgi:hypothetical protein